MEIQRSKLKEKYTIKLAVRANREQYPQAGMCRATDTFMVTVLYSLRRGKWKYILTKEWLWK